MSEFFLGVKLGVIGAGAVGAALGSVRGSLDGLGRVMADLKRRQDDLGGAIARHMGTLAPRRLLFAADGGKKVLIRIDYRVKKPQRGRVNIVRTGAVLTDGEIDSLRGQLGNGMTLLDGHL